MKMQGWPAAAKHGGDVSTEPTIIIYRALILAKLSLSSEKV